MYAKFSLYSVAKMYALSLNNVSIILGRDHSYWVVNQSEERMYKDKGCVVISNVN